MLAAIFALNGYEAVPAYDGASGLEQARSVSPEMIVSDVIMPGINGAEMAIQVLQFLPSCKILLLTGQVANNPLLEDAAGRGYKFDILPKPISPADLLARLNTLRQKTAA